MVAENLSHAWPASNRPDLGASYIQECGNRQTGFGLCSYIKIRRYDEKPMSFSEVWARFEEAYPENWAFQMFPPEHELVNDANIYHLFIVWDENKMGDVNIKR